MYKNLLQAISDLGIKKTVLKDQLGYGNLKALSIRLNGSTRFDPLDQQIIFDYLIQNGFSGNKEYLFEYSDPVIKKKSENRLSRVIKELMKEQGLKNRDIKEYLDSNNRYISENTISAWRNGKARSIDPYYLYPLCNLFKVPPKYLTGFDSFKAYEFDPEIDHITERMYSYYEQLLDDIVNLVIYDDARYKEIEKALRDKDDPSLRNSLIQDLEIDIYPKIKEMLDKSFGLKHLSDLPNTQYWKTRYERKRRNKETSKETDEKDTKKGG
ncbi:MAG: helix-turn-helix transcriptional regulator [Erysipelotrichaceae bacterium]|nr:helix-turn-helix transcriptional regulator [Erysipelotrichaceae bacterium]